MKTVIAFAFIIGSITTVACTEVLTSEQRDERKLTSSINIVVQKVTDAIKLAGLDPLHVEKRELNFVLPIPDTFIVAAHVGDFKITGISNIVVLRVSYAPISGRITLDFEWPHININIGTFSLQSTLLGKKFDMKASGSVQISKVKVQSVVRMNVGVVSGVLVRSIDVSFDLGTIQSNVNLVAQGKDFSRELNNFISKTIPDFLEERAAGIKKIIEKILLDYINASLDKLRP